MAIKQIWQAFIIIFVGNFDFIFLLWGFEQLPFKGGAEFTIFIPYLFTATAIKLLVYDYFDVYIKRSQNKVGRIMFRSILILSTLSIAVALQTTIYYTLARAT